MRHKMIDYSRTIRDGRTVVIHRCLLCTMTRFLANQEIETDNGFTPTDQPINHLPLCPVARELEDAKVS